MTFHHEHLNMQKHFTDLGIGVEDHDVVLVEVVLREVDDLLDLQSAARVRAVEEARRRQFVLRLQRHVGRVCCAAVSARTTMCLPFSASR